jgi:hypothetical protein
MPQMGPWFIVVVVVLLISFTGQLSVIRLALGPHITVRDSIVHGARRVFLYLGAVVVWLAPIFVAETMLVRMMTADRAHPSVAAALGVIAISLIGLIVAVRLTLLSAVASAEDVGSIAMLRRTWELTRGNWWRLFGFILIFGIGALALVWATGLMAGLLARIIFGDLSSLSVGGLLVNIVAQLVSGALSVVLFVMIARLYAQRGAAGVHPGVPISGI